MYSLTTSKAVIEDTEVIVYGIHCSGICSVYAVSTDRDAVLRLVNDFNKYGLDPIHMRDAIEDFLE